MFVSRGGGKLRHALDRFGLEVRGLTAADFGCNVGGFTDCLLQAGASRVYAIDTGYGTLAWKLRNDPRVAVMERTNALHAPSPEPVDLVAIDLAWTPQHLSLPAALRWLKPSGRIITLIKPHYEARDEERASLRAGVLADADAERITDRVLSEMPSLGVRVLDSTPSPLRGGAGKGSKGNTEWLALLAIEAPGS